MPKDILERIPDRSHYSLSYLQHGRVFSYAHQIQSTISFSPENVLEVGAGGGIVAAALRAAGIHTTIVDIQSKLNPNVVASVTQLPFKPRQYDVVICCQVLEHLPFDMLKPSIQELWRVSNVGLVISLPNVLPHYEIRLKLPKLHRFSWTGTRRRDPGPDWKKDRWDSDGHYWEIGYADTSLEKVKMIMMEATGVEPENWRVPEKPYHHFFLSSKD